QLFGILHPNELEFFIDDLINLAARFISKLFQWEGNVIAHIARTQQRRILINHANVMSYLLKLPASEPRDFKALEENRAGIGTKRAEDQSQNSALTTAALTHDDQALLRPDLERNTVKHFLFLALHLHIEHVDHV